MNFLLKIFQKLHNKIHFASTKKAVQLPEATKQKQNFLNSIQSYTNDEIIILKIKLDNGEFKAIDLTDEQIDLLQPIYDKEILEKQEKLNKLKAKKVVE